MWEEFLQLRFVYGKSFSFFASIYIPEISTSYELTQQYNVFMIFQLASDQSWIISHSRKLKTFESPSPMDSRTLSRGYETQSLHLHWPPMDFSFSDEYQY